MKTENIKPIETGNSVNIKEICSSVIQLPLIRYQTMADYYTKEPTGIFVKCNEKDDDYITLEQIFRLRMWIPNYKNFSWSIYSNNRDLLNDEDNHILIRNVIWNKKFDIDVVKNAREEDKEKILNNWPTITIKNIYLNRNNSNNFIKEFSSFDDIISKGITFKIRNKSSYSTKYSDIELMRLYDWGLIQSSWCPAMYNELLENAIPHLCEVFEKYILYENEKVFKMNLDYLYPIDEFKKIVSGEK